MLPGNGAPHAIFLPRQKKQASGGFFKGMSMGGIVLRLIDGDCANCRRNSVGGVDGGERMWEVSDGLRCEGGVLR